MEESRITGRAIAKRLGISPATVSLALNGRPGVNPKTREAILACQETLSRQEDKMFPDKILLISAEISSPSDHGLFKQSYTELYRILNNHSKDDGPCDLLIGKLLQQSSFPISRSDRKSVV